MLAFFTVQSNVLVGVTSAWLALRPEPGGTAQRSLRLTAPGGIVVTEIVFPRAAPGAGRAGCRRLRAPAAAHRLGGSVRLRVVGCWARASPSTGASRRGALVFPVAWLVFTLVGGAAIGFWPHPLLGADDFGFGVPLSA